MEKPVRVGEMLLGKYRVERMLGRGGMGYVLAVRHVELDELFALKLLSNDALRNADAVARFVREARAAARLKSEHVARVVDVGHFEDGSVYIVMEHLQGRDLGEELRDRGPLPVEEAITYVLQACEAISEVHAEGFVHRDIKPGNLFLTHKPNGRPCIKVLDFGIAKHLESEDPDLTMTGVMLGSPRYMSPEQMRRTRTVDARSDVWSMGVVLFKLLTNTLPFRGESVPEVISSVLFDAPLSLSSLRPGLPIDLDSFFASALEKEPDLRFQTIDELAQALTLLRDEVWDRSSDSGVKDRPATSSSPSGGPTSSVPTTRNSRPHEAYAPAIPVARISRPHDTPVPGALTPGDIEALLAPTEVLGRGTMPRPVRPPESQERTDGSTRRSEIESVPVLRDETRLAAARSIAAPPHEKGRLKSFVAGLAVLGVVAFGSAWIARSCTRSNVTLPGALQTASTALGGRDALLSGRQSAASSPPALPPDPASATAALAQPSGEPSAAAPLPSAAPSGAPSGEPSAAPVPSAPPSVRPARPRPLTGKLPVKPVPSNNDIHTQR